MKYYVVLKGKIPGIYTTWNEAKEQIYKYPGALYKSFNTLEEAQEYQKAFNSNNDVNEYLQDTSTLKNTYLAYTDGSYSMRDNTCGYGIVLITPDNIQYNYCGNINFEKNTNNIAELYAIFVVLSNVKQDIIIYSDSRYSINAVTTPTNNKSANKELIEAIQELMKGRNVEFRHVKAHADNELNNLVDELANIGRTIKQPLILHSKQQL